MQNQTKVNVLLNLLIIIFVAPILYIDRVSQDMQWVFFDVVNLIRPLPAILIIFYLSSNMKTKVKAVFCSLLCLWVTLDYAILTAIEESEYFEYVRNFTAVSCASVCFFVTANIWLSRPLSSHRYSVKGSYIVLKSPRTISECLAGLVMMPYGREKLVVNGRQFAFYKGVFIETEHSKDENATYRRIEGVPIERARSFLGAKWRPWANCFSIVSRIRKR